MIFGITIGDSSGVGPEILLKAFRNGELKWPIVAYGDLTALAFYNDRLALGVDLRPIPHPAAYVTGPLNVIDAGVLRREDITPGQLARISGAAARAYVVNATRPLSPERFKR